MSTHSKAQDLIYRSAQGELAFQQIIETIIDCIDFIHMIVIATMSHLQSALLADCMDPLSHLQQLPAGAAGYRCMVCIVSIDLAHWSWLASWPMLQILSLQHIKARAMHDK